MSTSKPRITITLEPHSYEVLQRLASAKKVSMSSVVSDFLDLGLPSMERMVVFMEQALLAAGESRAGMLAALDRAEAKILPILADAVSQSDLFVAVPQAQAATAQAARGAERTARPERAVQTPGLVTRGSGRQKTPPRVPSKGGQHGKV